jgi:hypothetical protein
MTRLDEKLALHRALTSAVLAGGGKVTPEAFDDALESGYKEIDRLFADDEGRGKRLDPFSEAAANARFRDGRPAAGDTHPDNRDSVWTGTAWVPGPYAVADGLPPPPDQNWRPHTTCGERWMENTAYRCTDPKHVGASHSHISKDLIIRWRS